MAKKKKSEAPKFNFRTVLKDGSVLLGDVNLSTIHLATEFGDLNIPLKNISSIKMGVKADELGAEKIIDIVELENTYNLPGKTGIKQIEIKTEYGALSIPAQQIERIEITETADGKTVFKLIAAKHISGNISGGWYNTSLVLKKGQSFSISASGEVVLASLSGAKYTPDGPTINNAASQPAPNTYPDANAYPNYGNVVFKVGEQGVVTKGGSKFNGSATENGLLYLSIYETVFNAANSGSYLVKVKVK